MFRMGARAKARVIRVALVLERLDRSSARSVERERVLLFDEAVGGISRMRGGRIALGLGHGCNQRRAALGIGGMESGFLERRHGVAPNLLRLRNLIGGLQH